ncbi:MAG: hypothetical protein COA50_16420 [Flavobacteriaceae bacterium]|nr:MAG: hypothetical protein COA50_16420 [Flavobacteriaceae bacterium]
MVIYKLLKRRKMKIINIYSVVMMLIGINILSAQQDPNFTFYMYNMNLINPAFAGANDGPNLGLNVRSQWASVQGAPETQSFIFGTPLGKKVGLGISIVSDKTFIETQTALSGDFSYKLPLSNTLDLYLGIKAGFNSYDVNAAGLITYGIASDPSLMDIDGQFSFNAGLGFYLKHKDYYIAFSMPKILTPDRLTQDGGRARLGTDKIHYYATGGYTINLSSKFTLKPSAMVHYVEAAPISIELTALIGISNRIDFGASYRYDESISGLFIFKTKNWLEIGYAYEVAFESPVRNIDNGTHEILFNLKL